MPATQVLQYDMDFPAVPVIGTKRGFSIPRPAVLRTTKLGTDDSHDKEWDARSASLNQVPKQLYVARMIYRAVGKAHFTKTVKSITEVDRPTFMQARKDWMQFLHDNAEDFTNTHVRVTAGYTNRVPNFVAQAAAAPTPVAQAVAQAMPIVVNNGPLPMKTWDPNDPDLAHDLFEVPADNPDFIPDTELFKLLDVSWQGAMLTDELRAILLMGDTSTGKTESVMVWCARNDVLHVRIDCGQFGEIYDVTGPIKAVERNGASFTEWVKGKTIRAMADPRPAVLHFDEVNRISDVKAVNVLLPFMDVSRQSYFDDNQTWMKLNGVKMIVGTMNGDTRGDDIGEYVGTQPLDQAFISRFPIRRQLRYPGPDKLKKILEAKNHGALPDETLVMLAEIANELVALNKYVPNLRELFAAMDFLKAGIDMYHALKWTVGGVYKDDGTPASDFTSFTSILKGKHIPCDDLP